MELKPDMRKNSVILYSSVLILDLLYFYTFMHLSFDVDIIHYIVLALINIPSLSLFTASLIKTKFILKDKYLEHHQLFRVMITKYDDIAYIDIPMSRDTPNIYMIRHNKKTLIITSDKDKILLKELLKRCKNTLTVDQMEERGFFKEDEQKKKKK